MIRLARTGAALALLGAFATLFPLVAPAAAWDIRTGAPEEALEEFHRTFTLGVYPYPRHSASPLGVVGFDVWVEAAVVPEIADQSFADAVIVGSPAADALAVARVGARKGLPGGFDLGVAYAQVLETDVEIVSAELSWAILEGGALSPALGLRATGARSVDGGLYELDQAGIELIASKGFTVVTPYVGGGLVWSESRFDRDGDPFVTDSTEGILFGGIVINLLVPKIVIEVERGEELQGAVRLAIGL